MNHYRILLTWSIVILYGLAIFLLSSTAVTVKAPQWPHLDKIVHAAEFGLFSVLLYQALHLSFQKKSRIRLVFITVLLSISYGILDEYHQSFNPARSSEFLDVLADSIGVAMAQGVILARTFLRS